MKKKLELTREQQELVEANLSVVHWIIVRHIHVNNASYGFEYEDLYQEGCIWLCNAAATYDMTRSKFTTYAKKVVYNGLIAYCRDMYKRQSRQCYLSIGEQGELLLDGKPLMDESEDLEERISRLEIVSLLESRRVFYRGVARKGIDALVLKVKGMSISEIAALYGVKPSHVGAWISRSSEKLRHDPVFLNSL